MAEIDVWSVTLGDAPPARFSGIDTAVAYLRSQLTTAGGATLIRSRMDATRFAAEVEAEDEGPGDRAFREHLVAQGVLA